MQDTYYVEGKDNVILRSQTSGAQIREMLTHKPPIRVISPGRVFRCESVSARKHNQFHQVEGLLIDKDITFGDLKGILNEFIKIYFEGARPTRMRNSFSRSPNRVAKLTFNVLCVTARVAEFVQVLAGSKFWVQAWLMSMFLKTSELTLKYTQDLLSVWA